MGDLDFIAKEIRGGCSGAVRFEADAREFVGALDRCINQIYYDAVERYYVAPPWDMPGVQLAICCYLAWGEVRSVETFTRQAAQLGVNRPRLRLLLSKQIYEEMIHHQMFREAAIKIGGVDPLWVAPPSSLMSMFDSYDFANGATDILEKIFYAQFCSERAVIPSFKRFEESARASRRGIHPLLERAFSRVLADEPGHVAVGRIAARELADKGVEQRERMLDLAIDIITVTVGLWKNGRQNVSEIVKFAASLVAAKAADKWKPQAPDNFDWQGSPLEPGL